MDIIKLPVSEIKPYAKNAKIHTDEQVQHIANSIKAFGFNDPIGIWGDDNVCVEGHGRLLALKRLGVTEVECIRLDHLSDDKRRAYALAHNKTAIETGFDFDLLSVELGDLDVFDFDMSEFGVDFDDVDNDDKNKKKRDSDEMFERLTFDLAPPQAQLIRLSLFQVKGDITDTFDNTHENGNALYEIVRQWAERVVVV